MRFECSHFFLGKTMPHECGVRVKILTAKPSLSGRKERFIQTLLKFTLNLQANVGYVEIILQKLTEIRRNLGFQFCENNIRSGNHMCPTFLSNKLRFFSTVLDESSGQLNFNLILTLDVYFELIVFLQTWSEMIAR